MKRLECGVINVAPKIYIMEDKEQFPDFINYLKTNYKLDCFKAPFNPLTIKDVPGNEVTIDELKFPTWFIFSEQPGYVEGWWSSIELRELPFVENILENVTC